MTMKQEKKRIYLQAALTLAALLVVLLALDNLSFVPSMLLTVLRKGAIYALVAVSMNLLNGFTGLFSLGQAGFMLLGAYTYAILTIPAASQKSIYQRYANGGIGFSIPELLSKPLGGFGLLLGIVRTHKAGLQFLECFGQRAGALFRVVVGEPVERQIARDAGEKCAQHARFFRRDGIPGVDPHVAQALLRVPLIRQDAPDDAAAKPAVFFFALRDALFAALKIELHDLVIVQDGHLFFIHA